MPGDGCSGGGHRGADHGHGGGHNEVLEQDTADVETWACEVSWPLAEVA